MKIAKVILCLTWLTPVCLIAQEAKVTPVLSKDLTGIPGKEGLMITVEYPPGSSDPIHRHNAHGFIYVPEGSIVMQVRGGKEVTLTPGQTFYEGPDDVHVVGRNAKPHRAGEIHRVPGQGQGRTGVDTHQVRPPIARSMVRPDIRRTIERSTTTANHISYPALPHGFTTTHADQVNADLLNCLNSVQTARRAAWCSDGRSLCCRPAGIAFKISRTSTPSFQSR